jgi:hypothetical protein
MRHDRLPSIGDGTAGVDHVELGIAAQELFEAAKNERMVIDHHESDGHAYVPSAWIVRDG